MLDSRVACLLVLCRVGDPQYAPSVVTVSAIAGCHFGVKTAAFRFRHWHVNLESIIQIPTQRKEELAKMRQERIAAPSMFAPTGIG
jgi:hypothetical protein